MEIINAQTSATTTAHHIPFTPNIIGIIITAADWKTSVLKNDIAAETPPLLSAVKKPDAKMLKPHKRKCIA